MGLMFSSIISYAGVLETIECIRHILSGMVPEGDPDFHELVIYYKKLLEKTSEYNTSTNEDWNKLGGQGYLSFGDDEDGNIKSATIKYYDSNSGSAALLFTTKISSFGQESVESTTNANDGYASKQSERYTTTKTMVSNTSESFSVGKRNKSPTDSYENISDPTVISENSFISKDDDEYDKDTDAKGKLTWHYRPLSPTPPALPEIHFQSYDESGNKDTVYTEDYLRSLDGIKFRPLQRSDPSGRRRSFKKRHSSSSTSSKDSRASREEELKVFTSLEEAEFERMDKDDNVAGFGSTPNLATRSYSRSRSRDNSKERRPNETWSVEGSNHSIDIAVDEAEHMSELKPKLSELPKLGSFEEELPEESTEQQKEVNEEEEVEVEDFWGNSGD